MKLKGRTLVAALVVSLAPAAVVVTPSPAFAQDEATLKAARARFQEGVDYYDKGQYEAARAAFKQAYALKQHPAVLLNLAQSSLKSGHPVEAAKFFDKYVKDTDPAANKKGEAQKGLTDSLARIGRLNIMAAPGSKVTVDGQPVGTTPLSAPVDVEPGQHIVHATAPDGSQLEQKFTVAGGQTLPAQLGAVVGSTGTPPPDTGTGAPPPETGTPPPGTGTPPPGTGTPPPETGNPPPVEGPEPATVPRHDPIPMIIGGGVAVVGFVMAGIFAGLKGSAQSKADSVDQTIREAAGKAGIPAQGVCNNPPNSSFAGACDTLKSNQDAVNQDATVANVGVVIGIVGLAGAVGGALYYFLARKPAPGAQPALLHVPVVTGWVGAGSGGLGLSGSF